MLEELTFDLTAYLATGQIIKQPTCLLAFFDPTNERTLIYSFPEI
jgi:hypothetical protein